MSSFLSSDASSKTTISSSASGLLGRVDLEVQPGREPLFVDFQNFLDFSHELSEDLADLVAEWEPQSVFIG